MRTVAFALAAHPDDIEFMMAGTLLALGQAGWELHYLNLADGSLGSATMDAGETARVRANEAKNAAELLGATWHPPITADLGVFYVPEQIAKVCAVIRQTQPTVLLLQSPQDYMEDHINSVRPPP